MCARLTQSDSYAHSVTVGAEARTYQHGVLKAHLSSRPPVGICKYVHVASCERENRANSFEPQAGQSKVASLEQTAKCQ